MQLMRNGLKNILLKVSDAHAGLLMQRGLTDWEEDEKPIKTKLVNTIGKVSPNELYLLAFNRWLNATHESDHPDCATVSARIEGRLLTGLSEGGTLETGATTHHTYGMPMLAGSSIKGAVRSYTEQLFAKLGEDNKLQFKKSGNGHKLIIQEDKQKALDILFGTDDDGNDAQSAQDDQHSKAEAGYLIWHDAWWIPMTNDNDELLTGDSHKPFIPDIVTVHHQKYYSGELNEALDMENPVPNQQVAVQGGFYFVIQGEPQWAQMAKQLLVQTIEHLGVGAKGASGYGYFTLDDKLSSTIKKRFEMGKPLDMDADPLAKIRKDIAYLNEEQLIESLSRRKNKFLEKLGLDKDNAEDIAKVIQVVLEEHGDKVTGWKDAGAKNTKKAYKLINNHRPT